MLQRCVCVCVRLHWQVKGGKNRLFFVCWVAYVFNTKRNQKWRNAFPAVEKLVCSYAGINRGCAIPVLLILDALRIFSGTEARFCFVKCNVWDCLFTCLVVCPIFSCVGNRWFVHHRKSTLAYCGPQKKPRASQSAKTAEESGGLFAI